MRLTIEQAAARVDVLYHKLEDRRRPNREREDYFDGKQPLCYASDEWQKFHGDRFKGFADNWCGVVGSAAPELLEVLGVRLGRDSDVLSDNERQLWRWWDMSDGPAQSAQGFQSGAIVERSFALVWGTRDDEPVLTWEHGSQAIVDGEYGLKAWVEDDRELVTLYSADELWKFERSAYAAHSRSGMTPAGLLLPASFGGGGWKPREDDGVNPLPNPMGALPLIEFPNRPRLGRGPVSDIDGTMAMQKAANLMWAYLFGAADYASMPARVVMGQEPPKMPVLDENGNKVGEVPVDAEQLKRGRMLWLTGQDTKIGSWESARLDVFTNVIDVMVKHIAAQTKTPINYMGAFSNVNGETLDRLRNPLYSKVRDAQRHLDAPLRRVFRLFALAAGDRATAEACRTAEIHWMKPETATDAQMSDAALKDANIGWSAAGILERRYGMSQTEIDRELARRQAEALDPFLARITAPPVGDDAPVGA